MGVGYRSRPARRRRRWVRAGVPEGTLTSVRAVCVIGLGLIGGSVLRAAVTAGRTAWGATASSIDVEAARAAGYPIEPTVADALRRAAEEDALVVLAVPLPAVPDVL